MAEYKGKLLKGIFRQAKDVLFSSGNSVESQEIKSVQYSGTTSADGLLPISTSLVSNGRKIVSIIGEGYYFTFIYPTSAGYVIKLCDVVSLNPIPNHATSGTIYFVN